MPVIPNLLVKPDGSFALRQGSYIDARVLAANTAEVHTVPTDTASNKRARYVLFSADGDFYMKMGGAAAVPAADVTDGTASEANPVLREIPSDVTTIGLIAGAARVVTMQFFIG